MSPSMAEAWRRARPCQIAGPRHARLEAGLRVAPVPPPSGGFDTACARPPVDCQVGTKEPAL